LPAQHSDFPVGNFSSPAAHSLACTQLRSIPYPAEIWTCDPGWTTVTVPGSDTTMEAVCSCFSRTLKGRPNCFCYSALEPGSFLSFSHNCSGSFSVFDYVKSCICLREILFSVSVSQDQFHLLAMKYSSC
jgi:hypothetical protein